MLPGHCSKFQGLGNSRTIASACEPVKTIFRFLIILLLFTVVGSSSSHARDAAATYPPKTVILTDKTGEYPLGLSLEILEDPTTKLTIQEVASREFDGKFVPSQVPVPIFGHTSSAYWVRLRVKNEAGPSAMWRLEVAYALLQHVDLYLPQAHGPGFDVKRTGTALPFSTRDVPYRTFVFELPLAPASETTIYLRFQSQADMTLPLTIWSLDAFAQASAAESLKLGIFYGVLIIMAFYNLFLMLSLRDKSYFYYVICITAFLIHQLLFEGVAYQYLWPNRVWLGRSIELYSVAVMIAAGLKFVSAFLETKSNFPLLHRFINIPLVSMRFADNSNTLCRLRLCSDAAVGIGDSNMCSDTYIRVSCLATKESGGPLFRARGGALRDWHSHPDAGEIRRDSKHGIDGTYSANWGRVVCDRFCRSPWPTVSIFSRNRKKMPSPRP